MISSSVPEHLGIGLLLSRELKKSPTINDSG